MQLCCLAAEEALMRTISTHKGTREGLFAERWDGEAVSQPGLAGKMGGNNVGTPYSDPGSTEDAGPLCSGRGHYTLHVSP
jgi:hypothetical protein